jgi:hypothetical protein
LRILGIGEGKGRSGLGCGSGDGSSSIYDPENLLIFFTLNKAWDNGEFQQLFST